MSQPLNEFSEFEHQGWERVAGEFDATWGGLTRMFIPHLLGAVHVRPGDRVLDVACGPGYAAEAAQQLGAEPVGVDFSARMVRIAEGRLPGIEIREADAQDLPFAASSFDVVLINFGLLHLAGPENALEEAFRVLSPSGRLGFTTWAGPEESPGARLVEEVMEAHAESDVELPEGPDYYVYSSREQCRPLLAGIGFDPEQVGFKTVTEKWQLPYPSFLFEAEKDHGVRTAAFLAAQPDGVLEKIQSDLDARVRRYETDNGYAVPYAAHIISAVKAEA